VKISTNNLLIVHFSRNVLYQKPKQRLLSKLEVNKNETESANHDSYIVKQQQIELSFFVQIR